MKLIRKDYPKVRAYVKHGNTYYQVDLRRKGHEGQKFKGFNDREAALKFASDLGKEAAAHGIKALSTVKDERVAGWEATCALYGKRIEDAIALASNTWLLEKSKAESPFMSELLTLWVDDKTTGLRKLRPKSLKSIREMASVFKKFFGTKRIRQVTSEDIEAYLQTKNSAQTKKNNARYLQNFYNWAKFRKHYDQNPAEHWVKVIEVQKGTIEFYSVEQVEQIMRAVMLDENKHMAAFFALGLFGGVRPEEIAKMTWDENKNILMKTKEVKVQRDISKTKSDRIFKMSDTLFAWLDWCKDIKPLVPNANLQNYRKKITKRLGFPYIADGFRHTFATFHNAEHHNLEKLRSVMGNSPEIIQRHYKGVIQQEAVAKFNAITPEWLGTNPPTESNDGPLKPG